MRSVLLLIMSAAVSMSAQCQKAGDQADYEVGASDLLDREDYYALKKEQRQAIVRRKKKLGRELSAISRNVNLSGEEKSLTKRKLLEVFREDIDAILDDNQRSKWDEYVKSIPDREKSIAEIEDQLDALEEAYEKDMEDIAVKYQHDNDTKKMKEKERKRLYKSKKSHLEELKDRL